MRRGEKDIISKPFKENVERTRILHTKKVGILIDLEAEVSL